jgi:hypothetical protein
MGASVIDTLKADDKILIAEPAATMRLRMISDG